MKQQDSFNYKIVNGDLSQSVEALKKIFLSEMISKLIIKQAVAPLTNLEAIRAMSYNIRMAPCREDDATENAWVYRLPKVNMIIERYKPDSHWPARGFSFSDEFAAKQLIRSAL